MNDSSSIRTKSLSSKSALPPFHLRGWEQILFHRDPFVQGRPKSSHILLQQRPQSSHLRPQTSHFRKSFPLAIEAGSVSNTDSSTHEQSNSHEHTARRTSISDRNVQVLRAINDVLKSQTDSLTHELEETEHILRERQLDLSYISETELLAKDEILELRQQLREKEEIIRAKDELIREKDELIRQKDAGILEQTTALIRKDEEIEESKKELKERERILDELEKERKAMEISFSQRTSTQRTSTSRFREQDCPIFPDHVTANSDLDPTTDKRPLSKQSSLTKGKVALKEMLREQREVRSRKAAIKANIRASKVEEREAESRRVSEARSRASEASKRPGVLNDENADPAGQGDGGRTKSFVRLKSLVGGRRSRVHLPSKSRDFSISGSSEESSSS